MPERGSDHEFEVKELSILPIDKNSVEKSLEDIAENPHDKFIQTFKLIQNENPTINILARSYGQSALLREKGANEVMEGVIFGYKIIRDFAKEKGAEVPYIDQEALPAHHQDEKKWLESHPIMSQKKRSEQVLERVRIMDGNFVDGIKEMCKYKREPEEFYRGATQIYLLVAKTIDNKKLGKLLR